MLSRYLYLVDVEKDEAVVVFPIPSAYRDHQQLSAFEARVRVSNGVDDGGSVLVLRSGATAPLDARTLARLPRGRVG